MTLIKAAWAVLVRISGPSQLTDNQRSDWLVISHWPINSEECKLLANPGLCPNNWLIYTLAQLAKLSKLSIVSFAKLNFFPNSEEKINIKILLMIKKENQSQDQPR